MPSRNHEQRAGICAWCNESKKLVDAHIIPSAFYDSLSDGGVPLVLSSLPGFRPKKRPSGTYDSGILCEDCERRFSPWDDYGVHVFRDQAHLENSRYVSDGQGGRYFQVESNADGRLLCFVTSVLWRASVSTQNEYMRIRLGPHADLIKHGLLNPLGESLEKYSFVITRFTDLVGNKTMTGPHPFSIQLRHGSPLNAYVMSLPGWSLIVKVDQRNWPTPLDQIAYQLGKPTLALMNESKNYTGHWKGITEIFTNPASQPSSKIK